MRKIILGVILLSMLGCNYKNNTSYKLTIILPDGKVYKTINNIPNQQYYLSESRNMLRLNYSDGTREEFAGFLFHVEVIK